MTRHEAQDPEFERRVRDSFDRQRFMATLGARLDGVEPGEVDIELHRIARSSRSSTGSCTPASLATVADSACGYAALSLMQPGSRAC